MDQDQVNLILEGMDGNLTVTANKSLLCDNSKYFETMFMGNFKEEKENDIQLHQVKQEPFKLILDTIEKNDFQFIQNSSLEKILDVLECSNMLQFEKIQTFCIGILSERIQSSNCWVILQTADLVSERTLMRKCENFILFNIHQTTSSKGFLATSEESLLRILNNPHLNISSFKCLYKALKNWSNVNIVVDKTESTERMMKMASQEKTLPLVPCVVGYTYKNEEKKARIFCWDKISQKIKLLDGEMDFEKFNYVDAKGFKIASSGARLVMSGGEYSFGNSNWQKGVMLWSSFDQNWRSLGKLELSRRHHSVVIINKEAFLLGGFGKHRVILDSVVRVDLETGEQSECAKIPEPMYRPAVDSINNEEIILVGKQSAAVLVIKHNKWRPLKVTNFPKNIEFDKGMYDTTSSTFFLTSRISRELYQLKFKDGDNCDISLVGKFSSEAQNTCFIAQERVIYNFNSDEFGDERTVETYNVVENCFRVVWKDLVPEWDFSPHYSLGCFPLVNYDFRIS